jgi:hypothetical protein
MALLVINPYTHELTSTRRHIPVQSRTQARIEKMQLTLQMNY